MEVVSSGVCVNWGYESGCSLKEADRPYQCRMLVPVFNGKVCQSKVSDQANYIDMALRWKPYQHLIKDAIKKYKHLQTVLIIDDSEVNSDIKLAIESIIVRIRTFSLEE